MEETDAEQIREYPILVPHSDYGDPDCCGIIMPFRNGEYIDLKRNPGTADVDLMCNECAAVLRTVPVTEVEAPLLRMSMEQGVCSETCPVCGELNVVPGWTAMEAFTCRFCGSGVKVDQPVQ